MGYREDLFEAIGHILAQDESDFFLILTKIKKIDAKIAVVLSYFIKISLNSCTQEGWFHRTVEQISNETGLSKSVIENAKKVLLECGILHKKTIYGSKMLRIDLDVLKDKLSA